MGLIRNLLTDTVEFVRDEILPVRHELIKAGILQPPSASDNEAKATLTDPWSYNTMNYGYKEKYSYLDYSRARQVSYSDPILSAIIAARQNHVAAQSMPQNDRFQNGFRIRMRDKKKKPTKAADKKIQEFNQFISNCGFPETFNDTPQIRKRDNFETFLRKIVRDSLTFDQVNFEITPRKNGLPAQFIAVDAATIRLIPDRKEREDMFTGYSENGKRRSMAIDGFMAPTVAKNPYTNEAKYPRYAQVIQGVVRNTFDEWEMAFGVRNPRTDILANGYGFSEIEQLVSTITAHLNADTYNRRFFSQGSAIKGILTFEGTVPPDQLEAFRRQWHQQVSGVTNAWKTPIMALGKDGKMNWTDLHQTNRDMEWGKYVEYLIKVMCSVYQIDPVEIGFDISKQSMGQQGQGLGNSGDVKERIELSRDKGLVPLLRFIANMLNDYVIWRIDEDFELEFPLAAKEDSELDQKKKEVETLKGINEIRAEYDLDPLPSIEEDPDFYKNPGNYVQSQTFMQAIQNAQSIGQPMGGGMGGAPGEEGGPGQDMGGDEGGEPDYENMSTADLEAELAKMEGGGGEEEAKKSLEILV